MAREATPGTQPTTGWVQMQPNQGGIVKFRRQNIVVERHILSPNLTPEAGEVVGYDVQPELTMDLTKDVLDNWLEMTFRSTLKHSGGSGLSKFFPTAVTNGVPSFWTVAASGALPANVLVRGSGFTNAANNGLHVLAAGSTATSIKTNDALVTEVPPAGAILTVAGVQGASGDLGLDASGNLTSTVLDFTTLGLNVEQMVYIGDPTSGAAFAFATAGYVGPAIIAAIAAHKITFKRRAWTVGSADTGVGKTIRILFQAMVQNVPIDPTGANGYLLQPTTSLEVAEPGSAGSTDYTYLNGVAIGGMDLDVSLESKVTVKITMVGRVVGLPTSARSSGPSTALTPLQTDIFTTGANMPDIRILAAADESRISAELNKLTVSYKNNAKARKQLGTAGAADVMFGEYLPTGTADAYMLDNTLTKAIDNNTSATLDFLMKSADGGFALDFPLVKIRKRDKTYAAGSAVMQACDLVFDRDPTTGVLWACSLFSYLP